MSVDREQLERQSSQPVALASGRTIVGDGVTSPVGGFDAFGRVYVEVAVADFRQHGLKDQEIVFAVEQCDTIDGSYTEVDTLSFVAEGRQFLTVSGPSSFLRLSWEVSERFGSCRLVVARATPGSLDPVGGPVGPGGTGKWPSTWVTGPSSEITVDVGTIYEISGDYAFELPDADPGDIVGFFTPSGGSLALTGEGGLTVDGESIKGYSLEAKEFIFFQYAEGIGDAWYVMSRHPDPSSSNIDGGSASAVYTISQHIDGGGS